MNKKKYNTGGQVASGLVAGATSFIPGVGPALAPIAGSLTSKLFNKEQKKRKPVEYSSGYMATGGQLPTAVPIGNGATKYQGPKHAQGGIPIDDAGNPTTPDRATGEVEGDETKQGDYIFSDQLQVPGQQMTFAELHEKLVKENAGPDRINKLKQLQEKVKTQMGENNNYAEGGQLNKKDKLLRTAQRFAPSLTKFATAALMPKPEKTRAMTQTNVRPDRTAFRNAERNLGAGFRANPTQGMYAQYTRGMNQIASNEAQAVNQTTERNRQANMQTQQFNIRNEQRDSIRKEQDRGARVSMVDAAIQQPLTAAVMDKQGQQNQISQILTSADQIENAVERDRAIFRRLLATGLSRKQALQYVGNPENIN